MIYNVLCIYVVYIFFYRKRNSKKVKKIFFIICCMSFWTGKPSRPEVKDNQGSACLDNDRSEARATRKEKAGPGAVRDCDADTIILDSSSGGEQDHTVTQSVSQSLTQSITHTHTHTHSHTHNLSHPHPHTQTQTRTQTHTHTHTQPHADLEKNQG